MTNHKPITLVVSIDGVAPRHITPETMPSLINAGRSGAVCYQAQTILPSLTLPAHASMFYSVEASSHGVRDNTPCAVETEARSFLKQAREQGISTAMFFNWEPFEHILERDAAEEKFLINGGYHETEDDRITAATVANLKRRDHQLVFSYLARGDLAGHDYGWDSTEYVSAITKADRCLGQMIDALQDGDSLLVTTDHGGLGKHHEQGRPEDLRTFVVLKSPNVPAGTAWTQASILDVAPTVAQLVGMQPDEHWVGSNLIGKQHRLADWLWDLLVESDKHQYGESVSMLDHALQAAQLARDDGCKDSMVLAGLLHDVGHLMGKADHWGFADHADAAGEALQQILNPCVYQPIASHVAAKRFLVTTNPDYKEQLSEASIATLEQQGGLLNNEETNTFAAQPFSDQAVELRRFDDQAKVAGKTVASLESYKPLLENALVAPVIDPKWARSACVCEACRDSNTGQRLISGSDLQGWRIIDESYLSDNSLCLQHQSGEIHECVFSVEQEAPTGSSIQLWGSDYANRLRERKVNANADLDAVVSQLVEAGIVLIDGLSTQREEVLKFAERIGFVRETNYGRLFEVKATPDPNNLAYTPLGLPLHTDNPYRHPTPGVQLLHCLQNAKQGGASMFADGFRAAEELRAEHPEAFELLTQYPVLFRFQDQAVTLESSKTIIDLAPAGDIQAIHLNHRSMQPPTTSTGQASRFIEALELFVECLNSEHSTIEITLQPGELIAFDNGRVLHGRKAYSLSEPRHLQGCYIDMDAVRSLYAKLKN